jgi:hypothetical protein
MPLRTVLQRVVEIAGAAKLPHCGNAQKKAGLAGAAREQSGIVSLLPPLD